MVLCGRLRYVKQSPGEEMTACHKQGIGKRSHVRSDLHKCVLHFDSMLGPMCNCVHQRSRESEMRSAGDKAAQCHVSVPMWRSACLCVKFCFLLELTCKVHHNVGHACHK